MHFITIILTNEVCVCRKYEKETNVGKRKSKLIQGVQR